MINLTKKQTKDIATRLNDVIIDNLPASLEKNLMQIGEGLETPCCKVAVEAFLKEEFYNYTADLAETIQDFLNKI